MEEKNIVTINEKEIAKLLDELQTYEDIDPAYLPEELKELRHKIMQVHLRLEASLDQLMASYSLNTIEEFMVTLKKYDKSRLQATRQSMQIIFDAMDFSRKVKVAKQMKKINNNVEDHLYKVNNLRLVFSHPTAYQDLIMQYKDRKKYKDALLILKEAYQAMNTVMKHEYTIHGDREILSKKNLLDSGSSPE
jgi:hypothetical protein